MAFLATRLLTRATTTAMMAAPRTFWRAASTKAAAASSITGEGKVATAAPAHTGAGAGDRSTYMTSVVEGSTNGAPLFDPAMFRVDTPSDVGVHPMSGTTGAEVLGVDLSLPLSAADKERILDAYFRYGCVFFRDQNITHAEHMALAESLGEPEAHPIVAGIEGYPKIVRIIKEANAETSFGETWHSDHSFMDEPCVGSILVARELPPFGNDTLFASMYAVYDSLSDGMKSLLDGLTAVHSAAYAFNPEGGNRQDKYDGKQEMKYKLHPILEREVEHPAVITHPVTGKKALFVNSMFTYRFKGMTRKESLPILEYLFSVVAQPQFQARFRWAPGSIAFWDNRAVQHMAIGDETRFRRVMERVTLKGRRPEA